MFTAHARDSKLETHFKNLWMLVPLQKMVTFVRTGMYGTAFGKQVRILTRAAADNETSSQPSHDVGRRQQK